MPFSFFKSNLEGPAPAPCPPPRPGARPRGLFPSGGRGGLASSRTCLDHVSYSGLLCRCVAFPHITCELAFSASYDERQRVRRTTGGRKRTRQGADMVHGTYMVGVKSAKVRRPLMPIPPAARGVDTTLSNHLISCCVSPRSLPPCGPTPRQVDTTCTPRRGGVQNDS